MTLTAPKLRVSKEGTITPGSCRATDIGDLDFAYWAGSGNGGPPIIPSYINGYYVDGSNHEVEPFLAVTDRTTALAGGNFSYDDNIRNMAASNIYYLESLGFSFSDVEPSPNGCELIDQNWLLSYMWLDKNFCLNSMFTQKSTNTTTKIELYTKFSEYSQFNVYLVALNGPTQGNKTYLLLPWTDGEICPLLGENCFTFYLPEHPDGAPDKVYYGLVFVFGGVYTADQATYNGLGECLFVSSSVNGVWSLLACQVNKFTGLPEIA